MTTLAARFEPENQSEVYRAQLKARRRKRGEALTELAQDIREQLSCECFVDALDDPDLEWAVFQTKPGMLSNAIKAALEYEAFQTGRKRRVSEKPVRSIQQPSAASNTKVQAGEGNTADATLQSLLDRLAELETFVKKEPTKNKADTSKGTSQQPMASKKRGDCNYCKQSGHWIADCPKLKRKHEAEQGGTQENKEPDSSPAARDQKRQGNDQ